MNSQSLRSSRSLQLPINSCAYRIQQRSNQVCDTRDPIVTIHSATIAPPPHAWDCCQILIHLPLSLGLRKDFTLQLVHCPWHSMKPHPHLSRKLSLEPSSLRSPSSAHYRSPSFVIPLHRFYFNLAQQAALIANTAIRSSLISAQNSKSISISR